MTHHCIVLTNFVSTLIVILSSVPGDKNWKKRRKNEGEYTPVAYQGALFLLLRRALTHPPLHASLRQTARYERIRDVYPGSRFLSIRFPDPTSAPKEEGKNVIKLQIILFLNRQRNFFSQNKFHKLLYILPKNLSLNYQNYGFGIRDPEKTYSVSGMPVPGPKRPTTLCISTCK
jgi:hypothetical protein